MRLNDLGLVVIITIVAACAVAGLASRYFYGPDAPIEEFAEEVIKEETGVSVDLSP